MANQDVKVSALNSVSTLSTDDLSLETVVDELSASGYTSKKITEGAKASQYLEAFTFANLNTTAKTIVGAINEAATTGGSDEFIIHMTDTTITETAADIIDAFDNGSEIWLESQITGETIKTRLPLLAYISDSSQLVLRFSGITYANNRYRYCDVQMLRSPEQIVGRQNVNVAFAVIDDTTTSASSVWSSQKTAGELADKAEIDDTATDTSTAWSSSRIASFLPTDTAQGAVANFPDGADNVPVDSLVVNIEPVQEGTGDPSPSNVRPISGWSAVNVTRTGANVWDEETILGYFDTAGNWNNSSSNLSSKNPVFVLPNTQYYIQAPAGVSLFVTYWKTSVTSGESHTTEFISRSASSVGNTTITTPSNCHALHFSLGAGYGTTYNNDISINCPATDTDYHAYTGISVIIVLGQTVYYGQINLTTGVLTSNLVIHNLGDLNYIYEPAGTEGISFGRFRTPMSGYKPAGKVICEVYKGLQTSVASLSDLTCCLSGTVAYPFLRIRDDNYSNADVFKNSLNNKMVLCELTTPVEVTLTPEQINTLKGVNNIWADTGDTTVEYRADVQKYIDKKIAEAVSNRGLNLSKSAEPEEPEEAKEEVKEEQEGDENVDR